MTNNTEKANKNPEKIDKKTDLGLTAKTLGLLKNMTEAKDSILSNLKNFEKSPYFEAKKLEKGELLFKEGDVDTNIYIIKKGNLSVEKFTSVEQTETKKLAVLGKGSILGEQALNNPDAPKQTSIKALNKVELLKIDTVKSMKNFMKEDSELGMTLLMRIISLANERLNNINEELTFLFEFNNKIASLGEINRGVFPEIFDFINAMIVSDYTIFLKSHPVLDNTLTVFYDSREEDSAYGEVISFEDGTQFIPYDFLEKLKVEKIDNIVLTKLNIGPNLLGYVIYGRRQLGYSENHKKILGNFSLNIASVVKQFDIQEDEKARLRLEEKYY
ncbi:MAG: cyclic nucleotide-binding domain-containing protein [Candidatus Gracilibacteria bacterium]|nr:cyclic nucleotide-binding domain-containing protein [Candidatus Gracilibacteria bacterium]